MNRTQRTVAIIAPALFGSLLAVFAIWLQDGFARGYASVVFLFWVALLAITLAIAAIVIISVGKGVQNAILLFVSAFTLPATYLFVLFVVRRYNGE